MINLVKMFNLIFKFFLGFFENLLYTIISLLFLFFIKKWYYEFINKNIGDYCFEFKSVKDLLSKNSNIFTKSCVSPTIEIISFYDDLRLRITNGKDSAEREIRIFNIVKYKIPFVFYISLLKKILTDKLILFLDKKINLDKSLYLNKKLKNEIENEISIYINNNLCLKK